MAGETAGHSYYRWRHEPCAFGWKRGNKPAQGFGQLDSVWEVDFEGKARAVGNEHPTQKPLRLFEIPMEQHTKLGDIVIEPFSGSGSQLVAAEKLRRRCRAMNISPAFVDVAIRWEKATGRHALLDGRPFEEVAEVRDTRANRQRLTLPFGSDMHPAVHSGRRFSRFSAGMDRILIPASAFQCRARSGSMCSRERDGAPRTENETMTNTKADALQKRIEWTRGDIRDDTTELANALAALARTAMEESKAFLACPDRTPSLALVRGQADLVESYVRAIEKKQAVLEALTKVAEWSGS